MKKLGKVLRVAQASGDDKSQALLSFLKVYRETPHSTTKVAPAMLLFGYSKSSGSPQSRPSPDELVEIHAFAKANDAESKKRMKAEYDQRMRAREPTIFVGSRVLIKQDKKNKMTSKWDPNPYEVTAIEGTRVTAERDGRSITRNVSFFKLFRFDDEDDFESKGQQRLMIGSETQIAQEPSISLRSEGGPAQEEEQGGPAIDPEHKQMARQAQIQPSGRRGRPTTENAARKKQFDQEKRAEQPQTDPPARSSARLAAKQQQKPLPNKERAAGSPKATT